MRLYWEVARRGYQRFATYRAATVAGVSLFTFDLQGIFIHLPRHAQSQ